MNELFAKGTTNSAVIVWDKFVMYTWHKFDAVKSKLRHQMLNAPQVGDKTLQFFDEFMLNILTIPKVSTARPNGSCFQWKKFNLTSGKSSERGYANEI